MQRKRKFNIYIYDRICTRPSDSAWPRQLSARDATAPRIHQDKQGPGHVVRRYSIDVPRRFRSMRNTLHGIRWLLLPSSSSLSPLLLLFVHVAVMLKRERARTRTHTHTHTHTHTRTPHTNEYASTLVCRRPVQTKNVHELNS